MVSIIRLLVVFPNHFFLVQLKALIFFDPSEHSAKPLTFAMKVPLCLTVYSSPILCFNYRLALVF